MPRRSHSRRCPEATEPHIDGIPAPLFPCIGGIQQSTMKIIDVNQEAYGVIAIGQHATGLLALGQIAFGVIAIGQGAAGLIVLGQGAVGLLSIGQGAVGLIWTGAMVGVGGRGFGIVLPLTPSLGPQHTLPEARSLDAVRATGDGWATVTVRTDHDGVPLLAVGDAILDARLDVRLRNAAQGAANETLLAHFTSDEDGLICDRLMTIPSSRLKQAKWWNIWAAQLIGLTILTVGVWIGVFRPLIEMVIQLLTR
ncbi:MAG: hypothetical protein AAFV53_04250 [Myxococcota bacterium]